MKPTAPTIDRRSMFFSSGAIAAGALLLNESLAQADNPAAGVADRLTSLKISNLKAMRAGGKGYVKIETNQGITGWGEVTGLDPTVACALANSLFELLKDQNPTRIEHLWQRLYRSHRDQRGGPYMTHTISAIDMALWDITGKFWVSRSITCSEATSATKFACIPRPRPVRLPPADHVRSPATRPTYKV